MNLLHERVCVIVCLCAGNAVGRVKRRNLVTVAANRFLYAVLQAFGSCRCAPIENLQVTWRGVVVLQQNLTGCAKYLWLRVFGDTKII